MLFDNFLKLGKHGRLELIDFKQVSQTFAKFILHKRQSNCRAKYIDECLN